MPVILSEAKNPCSLSLDAEIKKTTAEILRFAQDDSEGLRMTALASYCATSKARPYNTTER